MNQLVPYQARQRLPYRSRDDTYEMGMVPYGGYGRGRRRRMGVGMGGMNYDPRMAYGRHNLGQMIRSPFGFPPPPIRPSSLLETPVGLDKATVYLVNHLTKTADEVAKHIQYLRLPENRRHPRAVIHSWFTRLAEAVFAGQLSPRRVELMFAQFRNPDRAGRTYAPGLSPRSRRRDCVSICLNGDMIGAVMEYMDTGSLLDHVMAMLLHQMIHAYFLVACGQQNDSKEPDGRLKHSEHFGVILYKIKELSSKIGSPLPLDFKHTLQYHRRGSGRNSFKGSPLFTPYNCTECFSSVEVIPEEKIKDWYKNKCVKAVDPDVWEIKFSGTSPVATPLSKSGDKKAWVELIHKKKINKLQRTCLSKFPSFAKNFEGEKRSLTVSNTFDDLTFVSLFHFLNYGSYCPDISNPTTSSKGAPLIAKEARNYAPITKDINIYKLALTLKFNELRRHVLNRLKDYEDCFEDPTQILYQIYSGTTDRELCAWAKDFMRRYATPQPGQSPIETSNWRKLRDDPRFHDMRAVYDASLEQLNVDFYQVEKDLGVLPAAPIILPPPPTFVQPYWLQSQAPQPPPPSAPAQFWAAPQPTVQQPVFHDPVDPYTFTLRREY